MLKVELFNDVVKVREQIEALKYQIENDTNDKDREIHQRALEELEKHKQKLLTQYVDIIKKEE